MLHKNDIFTPVIVKNNDNHMIEYKIDKHHYTIKIYSQKNLLLFYIVDVIHFISNISLYFNFSYY